MTSRTFLALTVLLLVLCQSVQGLVRLPYPDRRPWPPRPFPFPGPCPYAGCEPKPWDPPVLLDRQRRQLSVGVEANPGSATVNVGHSGRWGDFSASGTFARGQKPSWGVKWSKTFGKRSANRGQ